MKNIFLFLAVVTLAFSCDKQEPLPPNTYEITVTAKGVFNGLRSHIKIIDAKRSETIIDTAIVMNETFIFKGKTNAPAIRVLSINSVNGSLPFVLEPGRTTIEIFKDSLSTSVIKGSPNNIEYSLFKKNYMEKAKAISLLLDQVKDARTKGNRDLLNELRLKDKELKENLYDYAHEFIEEHPNSDLSLLLLESQIIGGKQNIEKFKRSIHTLQNVIERNTTNKQIGRKIDAFIAMKEAQANLDVGKIAPDFTAPMSNGDMLSLNDIKGKATIIDFWASWCGPCRRENPNVVKVYEKYKDKGLEIISVSLDRPGQKERWLKAIKDDNLTWHHVSNLKYFNDPVARMYNINSIPATFILDESGKIVAKKLRGPALEKQISAMLD